ncbi:MAG: hypothetical protein HXY28_10785 [Hydrogenophilaceae bacterium]|nr:hypothetical protein [Hydrogenophilaceae bacterium]
MDPEIEMNWSAIRRVMRSGSILSALVGLSLFATLPENFGAIDGVQDDVDRRVIVLAAWAAALFFVAMIVYVLALLATMRMPGTIADHESQTTFLAFPYSAHGDSKLESAQEFWRARNKERRLSRWIATILVFTFLLFVTGSAAFSARMALEVIPSPEWLPTWLAQLGPR